MTLIEGLQTQLQNQFFSGAVLGGVVLGGLALLRKVPGYLYDKALQHLTVSVTIHSSDAMYDFFQRWLESNRFDFLSRKFRYLSGDNSRVKAALGPAYGTHYFRWKGKWVCISVQQDEKTHQSVKWNNTNDFLKITYLGVDKSYLHGIIKEVTDLSVEDKKDIIHIRYVLGASGGNSPEFSSKIKVNTTRIPEVVLDQSDLEGIENDLEEFLSKKEWYNERQIPYRRGYMLEGPPGTGKSSLVRRLAIKNKLDIYIADKASLHSITKWIRFIPRRSLLLLEEADTLFSNRETKPGSLLGEIEEQMTDFGSVLNALDGVASAEDIVIVMTTNYPERLDPALVRAGRIDYTLHMGLASEDQAKRLFLLFWNNELAAQRFAQLAGNGVHSPADLKNVLISSKNEAEALSKMETLKEKAHERSEAA